jgi:hypothetical protein
MQDKDGLKAVFKELRVFSTSKRAEKDRREVGHLGLLTIIGAQKHFSR